MWISKKKDRRSGLVDFDKLRKSISLPRIFLSYFELRLTL